MISGPRFTGLSSAWTPLPRFPRHVSDRTPWIGLRLTEEDCENNILDNFRAYVNRQMETNTDEGTRVAMPYFLALLESFKESVSATQPIVMSDPPSPPEDLCHFANLEQEVGLDGSTLNHQMRSEGGVSGSTEVLIHNSDFGWCNESSLDAIEMNLQDK